MVSWELVKVVGVEVRCMALRVHFGVGDWRSKCLGSSCSIRARPGL